MEIIRDRHLLYIPSREIERVLRSQGEVAIPSPGECRQADLLHWPKLSLCGAYYDLCFNHRQVPTQDQMVSHYFSGNKEHASRITEPIYQAMRKRVQRAYNTLIAEHHLLALCVESNRFSACTKSEALDLTGMVDILLRVDDFEAGIAVQVRSAEAIKWKGIKARRQQVRDHAGHNLWEGLVLPLEMNFREMQEVAGIHLFTPIPWIPRIRRLIEQERQALSGFGQLRF